MLRNLFGDHRPARGPDDRVIYAIGDIHGCAGLLDELLNAIKVQEEKRNAPGQFVFLGDYVDRGPDSRGVLTRLIDIAAERPDSVFLMGNHEEAMLDFLEDPNDLEEWLHWGGAETLESYGVEKPWNRPAAELADDLKERLPAEHHDFLSALEMSKIIGDYFFVHAGVKPGVPLDQQAPDDLLWIRREFHNAPASARPDKVVVHGHQPTKQPVDVGWRIGVDTGACFSGRLTAVVIDRAKRRFIST